MIAMCPVTKKSDNPVAIAILIIVQVVRFFAIASRSVGFIELDKLVAGPCDR